MYKIRPVLIIRGGAYIEAEQILKNRADIGSFGFKIHFPQYLGCGPCSQLKAFVALDEFSFLSLCFGYILYSAYHAHRLAFIISKDEGAVEHITVYTVFFL